MTTTNEVHVVFGAGQVGLKLAEQLWERGHQVRIVRRSGGESDRERFTWVRGDVMDSVFALRAVAGATTVYNCVNPRYHEWTALLPTLVRNIRAAATSAGARLVVLDNVYAYGPTFGAPMTEASPLRATSKKGALRKALFEETMAAHIRGEVRVAYARAADFVGPGVDQSAVFMPALYKALLHGKSAMVVVGLDELHSYTDVRDVVEALLILGSSDKGMGRAWHVPTATPVSTREYLTRLATNMGTQVRFRRLPLWLLRVAGVFSPLIRELPEMAYQWQSPFVLDGTDFTRTFGLKPRSIEDSVAATASWAVHRSARPLPAHHGGQGIATP